MSRSRHWETADETRFINGLGTHSNIGKSIGKLHLLMEYRKTLKRQRAWGQVDAGIVKRTLYRQLEAEMGGQEVDRMFGGD